MGRVRARGEEIRRFLLARIEKSPAGAVRETAERFRITRQAVHKHLSRLEAEGAIRKSGSTRASLYRLAPPAEWRRDFALGKVAEDVVWRSDIKGVLGALPENALIIWQYGFTEMFNNAIDHSVGSAIAVAIRKSATATEMTISDDGVGIFRKIQTALGLLDERHAILELAKGKLTTDPRRHTGEGIFFTSRMFDSFDILSGGVFLSHTFGEAEDWIIEPDTAARGTTVWMKLGNHTSRSAKKVFDQFSSGEDYGFTKTVVPVRLARYGQDQLISRSQARRLLARVELFETVLFDFEQVESIGPAFADEIFRVFASEHPKVQLHAIKANSLVRRMIEKARRG